MNQQQLIELIKKTLIEGNEYDSRYKQATTIAALSDIKFEIITVLRDERIVELRQALEVFRIENSNEFSQFIEEVTRCFRGKLLAYFKANVEQGIEENLKENQSLFLFYGLATSLNYLGILDFSVLDDLEKLSSSARISLLTTLLCESRRKSLDETQLINLLSNNETEQLVSFVLLTQLFLGSFDLANLLIKHKSEVVKIPLVLFRSLLPKNFDSIKQKLYPYQAAMLGYGNRELVKAFCNNPDAMFNDYDYDQSITEAIGVIINGDSRNKNVLHLIDSMKIMLKHTNNGWKEVCRKSKINRVSENNDYINYINYGIFEFLVALDFCENDKYCTNIEPHTLVNIKSSDQFDTYKWGLQCKKSYYMKTVLFICFYAYLEEQHCTEYANKKLTDFIAKFFDKDSIKCAQNILLLARETANKFALIPSNYSTSLLVADFSSALGLRKKAMPSNQEETYQQDMKFTEDGKNLRYLLSNNDYVEKATFAVVSQPDGIVGSLHRIIISEEVGIVEKELALNILVEAQNLKVADLKVDELFTFMTDPVDSSLADRLKAIEANQQKILSHLETIMKSNAPSTPAEPKATAAKTTFFAPGETTHAMNALNNTCN